MEEPTEHRPRAEDGHDDPSSDRPDATRRLDPTQEPTALMGPDDPVVRRAAEEDVTRQVSDDPGTRGDADRGRPDDDRRPRRPQDPGPGGVSPSRASRDVAPERPDDPRPRRNGSWYGDRDLPVAIASGLLLVGLLLGTLLTHPAAFSLLVAGLVIVGLIEAGRVVREHGTRISLPVLLLATVLMLIGAYRVGHAGQAIGLVALFVGAVVWELAEPDRRDVFRRIAATCLFGLWVPLLASYAILLVVRPVEGWVAVLGTVGVAAVGDVGAYAVGTRFGRHKLAPTISPGKSWEGVIGGIAIATVLGVLILPLLGTEPLFTPLNVLLFAPIVGAAGVLGDLTESMLKRDLGVKDFGGIIPGHGGILDRVDALLFALPTGYYVLALLGR